MSLNALLDDIKDDVTDTEIATECFIDNINRPTTNNVKTINLNFNNLSQEFKDKVNTFYNLMFIKDKIKDLPKVDKSMAMEVFTMLPNVDKTEEAKLTSSPSIINKDVINTILEKNIDINTIDQLIENINPIISEITNNKDALNSVEEYLTQFKEATTDDYNRLLNNPPIVVIDKVNVNMLTTELTVLVNNIYSYNKYDENSNLNKKILNIVSNDTLKKYLDLNKTTITLQSIYTSLINDLSYIENKKKLLENFVNLMNNIYANLEINKAIEIVNDSDIIIDYLIWIKTMHNIINTKDNFIEGIKDLLTFLD